MKVDKANYMLHAWAELREICTPLFRNTHVTYFKYIRFYQDGSVIVLDTHPKTLTYIFEQQIFLKPTDLLASNRYLFMSAALSKAAHNNRTPILKIYREQFNIEHLFAINQKKSNYCESFVFGSRSKHHKIIGFYLNNMQLFEKFSEYFMQQATGVINKSETHKIKLPEWAGCCLCVRNR